MANVADLKLIQIPDPEFPKTDTLVGSGPEYVVLTKADGVTYGMLTEDFKAFLGTVQVQVPKALAPTDPAPTLSGVYYPTVTQNEAGTPIVYTNAGGIEVNTAEGGEDYGKQVQIIYDGTDWSKVGIPLPEVDTTNLVAKTDIVNNLSTDDPERPLSASMGAVIEPRILPEGNIFLSLDRPDLDPIFDGKIEVDKDGFILDGSISRKVLAHDNLDRPDLKQVQIDKDGYIIDEKLSGIAGDDLNKLIVRSDIDRPDLALMVLDKYGNIILELPFNISSADPEESVNTYINPFNPPNQEGFSQSDDFLTDYSVFQQAWLDLMNTQIVNPDIAPYVSRTNKGKSSTKNLDIWRYDFKPENPKNKIILVAGTHASEKNYIQGVYNFCKMLLDPDVWTRDKDLERLRFETHFIIYPCLSPSSFFGFVPNSIGGRRPWETDDFPISWTKSGNTVTVTFEAADFPDTNGRLDANTYFSHPGLSGKLQVALFESSDVSGLPNDGYVIQSVINGRTITVNAAEGGASSGTARMYVGTDTNRNADVSGSVTWTNFTPSTTSLLQYSNDHVPYANDNKGTRPFSLAELIILRDDLIAESDFLFYLDCHSGSGKNYLARSAVYEPIGYGTALENIKYYSAQFSSTDFSAIRTDIATTPFTSNYIARELGKQGYTIEWNQLATTSAQDALDSLRWMTTVIIELLKLKN